MEDLPKKRKDFIDYVKSRLVRFRKQGLAIKEFKLSVNCFALSYMSEDVDLCLKLASESGVEVLELRNFGNMDKEGQDECYALPKSVIEVKSLTKLLLEGSIRVDQSFINHSPKFFSLRELCLLNFRLEEDEQAIEHLISCCPLIEIITLTFRGGHMKSLSMHGLQKLKQVCVDGIKEVYINEVSSFKSLCYIHDNCLDEPFKIDLIQCKYLKRLFLYLNRTTIITNKLFLELLPKFPFLEKLEIWNCVLSEMINISSVQLTHLDVSNCDNLIEANIDAPNLLSCRFSRFGDAEPIISFLNFSSQLEVCLNININDNFDVFDVRELLQNIKPQNVMRSLSLSIFEPIKDAPNTILLDISTPPPSIKNLDLWIHPINFEITQLSDILNFSLLCCCPTTISFSSFNTSTRSLIEFFYKTLMRRKEEHCFCSSSDTKCWWHNLKDVKVQNFIKIDENVDLENMLDSYSDTSEIEGEISLILEF